MIISTSFTSSSVKEKRKISSFGTDSFKINVVTEKRESDFFFQSNFQNKLRNRSPGRDCRAFTASLESPKKYGTEYVTPLICSTKSPFTSPYERTFASTGLTNGSVEIYKTKE